MTNKELLNCINRDDLNRHFLNQLDELQKKILTHKEITFEDQVMMMGTVAMLNENYHNLSEQGKKKFDEEFDPIFDENWNKWYEKNQLHLSSPIEEKLLKSLEKAVKKMLEDEEEINENRN